MKYLVVFTLMVLMLTMVSGASTGNNKRYGYRHEKSASSSASHTKPDPSTITLSSALPSTTAESNGTTFSSIKKPTSTLSSALPSTTAGSNGTIFSGDGTWFNNGLGSCGVVSTDTEFVAAMNAPQMDNGPNPNDNPLCDRKINITNPSNGKSVIVKIVDTCPPCVYGSVDMSPAAFGTIENLSVGRMKINWVYV